MSAPEKVLAVVWHKQKKYYYCGPATIQMILEYRGAGLIAQDSLWHELYSRTAPAHGRAAMSMNSTPSIRPTTCGSARAHAGQRARKR